MPSGQPERRNRRSGRQATGCYVPRGRDAARARSLALSLGYAGKGFGFIAFRPWYLKGKRSGRVLPYPSHGPWVGARVRPQRATAKPRSSRLPYPPPRLGHDATRQARADRPRHISNWEMPADQEPPAMAKLGNFKPAILGKFKAVISRNFNPVLTMWRCRRSWTRIAGN